MSEIKDLENRLSAALDRLGAALSAPPVPADDPEKHRLAEALDAEKVVTHQLEARVAALHEKAGVLEQEVARLKADLAARDALTQQFRRVNAQLRQNNVALREANGRGMADAHLINRAMLAELESIRASRDADRAEIDAVLAELDPLLEAQHA
jgi:uncharacterized small protein (DUF1192 family)